MRVNTVLQSLLVLLFMWNVVGLRAQSYCIDSACQQYKENKTAKTTSKNLNESTIRQIANEVTVEVISEGRKYGSGVIIALYESRYTVMTNEHVVFAGESIKIVTHDGEIHNVNKLDIDNPEGLDLAILQFTSDNRYFVADYKASLNNLAAGDTVYAAGYPAEADSSGSPKFTFISGQIEMLSDAFIEGGYQIGANLELDRGMSGGPLFNTRGEVVGINGMHSYPLWGNPYVFIDGTTPSEEARAQMEQYSWSVPSSLLFQLLTSTE
ncbi:MAG: serine protease [Cyanobacteria bacterium P01_D01_bin.1]